MADVTVYGFPISTFVNIVRLVLTHKNVAFDFHDLEPKMGSPTHLSLHPFNRVPILITRASASTRRGRLHSMSTRLLPFPHCSRRTCDSAPGCTNGSARWAATTTHTCPYHLSHERLIYPALGIAPDEKVVAHALPHITVALDVMERELRTDTVYLLGDQLTLADFFVLPTLTSLSMTHEGPEMLKSRPRIGAWRARMEIQPAVTKVLATVAPHIGKPVEHARKWVETHRPRY